jgi:hypothetical protein
MDCEHGSCGQFRPASKPLQFPLPPPRQPGVGSYPYSSLPVLHDGFNLGSWEIVTSSEGQGYLWLDKNGAVLSDHEHAIARTQ